MVPGAEPRFATVEEVARAFGIPRASSMYAMLAAPVLTCNQAVESLGRSVHVGCARAIVRMLLSQGWIAAGLRYGSMFSGIDTFAVGLEAELGEGWSYRFASECREPAQRALLAAWGARGLTAEAVHGDAQSEEAICEQQVGMLVCSPECGSGSRQNYDRELDTQRVALGKVWVALGYVRRALPKVVVVENVCEPCTVGPQCGSQLRLP